MYVIELQENEVTSVEDIRKYLKSNHDVRFIAALIGIEDEEFNHMFEVVKGVADKFYEREFNMNGHVTVVKVICTQNS
ncbi:hypothetical protein GGI09_004826, partial [Coemansia sp. S100]